MDSDDISIKKRFELQIDAFNKDYSIDAVSGTSEDFSSDGKKYGKRELPTGGKKLYLLFPRYSGSSARVRPSRSEI